MNLTFKGFLRDYVRELTLLDTDNLKKLLGAVSTESPAAAEALMAFAAIQGKADYLAKLAANTAFAGGYAAFAAATSGLAGEKVEEYLASAESPARYQKVWLAYLSKKRKIDSDRRVIGLMREKTLESLRASGTTVYSICKQLGLNAGNVYAYLNQGDVKKVSRATARRIMEAAIAM